MAAATQEAPTPIHRAERFTPALANLRGLIAEYSLLTAQDPYLQDWTRESEIYKAVQHSMQKDFLMLNLKVFVLMGKE